MQQELEKIVFFMEKDEVSNPVQLADGYMVIQLVDGTVEKFTSERDYNESKSKIEKVIFQRKSRVAANTYIKEMMLDKNLKLNPPAFYALSDQLSKIVKDKISENPTPIY